MQQKRITFLVDEDLAARLQQAVAASPIYTDRSSLIRDLVVKGLAQQQGGKQIDIGHTDQQKLQLQQARNARLEKLARQV